MAKTITFGAHNIHRVGFFRIKVGRAMSPGSGIWLKIEARAEESSPNGWEELLTVFPDGELAEALKAHGEGEVQIPALSPVEVQA